MEAGRTRDAEERAAGEPLDYLRPVVTRHTSLTPPMLSVVVVVVKLLFGVVRRICTRSPATTVRDVLLKAPPLMAKLAPPPLTLTVAGALMPLTVTMFELTVLRLRASTTSTTSKVAGVVSAASVVELKPALTPPMVRVLVVLVLNALALVWRTRTCWPAVTWPAALVKAPPSML